jgi:hypothetical protein
MTLSPPSEAFIRHKSARTIDNVIRNLCSLLERPLPYALPSTRASGRVVVVGAGPSLDASLGYLRVLAAAGMPVWTVNAAAPALTAAGVRPSVVVSRESVKVGSHLASTTGMRVADLSTDEDVWRQADAWFVPGCLQHFEMAAALDVRPLFGGTAALTATVALAAEHGATEIVLVGVDLAFAPDGAGYADQSAWGGYVGEPAADGRVALSGAGFARMLEAHHDAGIQPPPQQQVVATIERNEGSTGRALLTWVDQIEWLQNFAARNPRVRCVNATGPLGAKLAGWIDDAPIGGTAPLLAPVGEAVSRDRIDAAIADIRRECELAEQIASEARSVSGVPARAMHVSGFPTVDAAAAAAIMSVRDGGAPAHRSVPAMCQAVIDAAARVRLRIHEGLGGDHD